MRIRSVLLTLLAFLLLGTRPTHGEEPRPAEAVRAMVGPRSRNHCECRFPATTLRAESDAAAEEIRVYRDGSFPAVEKNSARTLVGAKKAKMSFESLGGDMSRSGNLAYSYGKYSVIQSESSDSGHYFQIWQTNNAGLWKMVLDWQQPLQKEKP